MEDGIKIRPFDNNSPKYRKLFLAEIDPWQNMFLITSSCSSWSMTSFKYFDTLETLNKSREGRYEQIRGRQSFNLKISMILFDVTITIHVDNDDIVEIIKMCYIFMLEISSSVSRYLQLIYSDNKYN